MTYPVISFLPSVSLPDVLCDPTDNIFEIRDPI